MVMERYFPGTIPENGYDLKSEKAINDNDEGNKNCCSESIDCNICLDLVKDPVVTFCGHLYCWPCIYKWIRFQTESLSDSDSDHQRTSNCPVCKAAISQETMIPLYVNGLSSNEQSKRGKALDIIPHRPSSPRPDVFQRIGSRASPGRYVAPQPPPPPGFSGGGGGGGDQIGMTMFGEMVYARIFGNSQTTVYALYPNSYNNIVSTNPRIRRHLMEADKSLSRLIFFLMCCMVLCLLLF